MILKINFIKMGAAATTINSVPLPGLASSENKIAASSLPFPTKGVKLSFANEFYELCGGKDKIKDLTTTDINEVYQKKITEKYKLSFCEYLSHLKHPAVGNET